MGLAGGWSGLVMLPDPGVIARLSIQAKTGLIAAE